MACGADVVVLAAATGTDGYDSRPDLDDRQWATLLTNLDRLADAAADRGVLAVLHPHVGTMVETRDEVDRVLDGSAIRLCLDTGPPADRRDRPAAAGRDRAATASPTPISRTSTPRWPPRCSAGELTYTEAVRRGMYTPLGTGDVDIAGIVTALRRQRLRRLVRHGAGHHSRRRAHR